MNSERTILAGLILDLPLHIGLGKGNKPTDSPLRRRGDGQFVIPGRAIGGSLRTLATRLAPRLKLAPCKALKRVKARQQRRRDVRTACLCPVCQLFGDLYPDEHAAQDGGGEVSRLWISDALTDAFLGQTHVRDGVGLDRRRAAAAHNVKFDYEVIPPGTTFQLRLRLIDNDSDEAAKRSQLLAAALAEWQAGRAWLGGNSARGLGRFHLEDLRCLKTDIQSEDALIGFLKADKPWEKAAQNPDWFDDDTGWLYQARTAAWKTIRTLDKLEGILPVARGFVEVSFDIVLQNAFLSNDPLVALLSGFDHAPLVQLALDNNEHAGQPVLAGSGLRGALRNRAEKIARTLATLHWQTQEDFLQHCPACDPLVRDQREPLHSCNTRLEIPEDKETPEDALCLACRLFGSTRRGSRLKVEDGVWEGGELNEDSTKAQDFLAIDRFTGGGLERAKFDAAPLIGAKFKTSLILEAPQDWELGWLALLLRDLAEGDITLGFGAAKGYGSAKAEGFIWTIGFFHTSDFPGDAGLLTEIHENGVHQVVEKPTEQPDWLPAGWLSQAQQWVDAFTQRAKNFQAGEDWKPFQKDSFFDKDGKLFELYGLPRAEISR